MDLKGSPLTEGRGLKLPAFDRAGAVSVSPLTEGRGLKHETRYQARKAARVAPHRGAWIETPDEITEYAKATGRPSQRGVD